MQITRTQQNARLRPVKAQVATPSVPEESVPQGPVDVLSNLPSNYQDIDVQPVTLPTSAPPALERPVVFVHGFNGSANRWGKVWDWLTDDPANKAGGILEPDKLDNIDPEANLFSLKLSRPYNSVETNKAELKATVEAVLAATGAEEVDLVVHSLGGLNARHYLQDDEEKVNKLVMLGTPNHGSQLANLELFFREKFNYPIKPPVDDDEVRRVLHQLSVDKLNRKKEPKNPWLRALNDDWSEHKQNADIFIVSGAGIPTLTGGPGLTIFGDGVVSRRSSKMSGVKKKTSWFRTHGGLQNSSKVMKNMANFLADKKLDAGENLFDTPEDALRAAEIVTAEKASQSKDVENKAPAEQVATAAQMPLLDPAFQFGLGLGVLAAMMGGPKEALPLVDIAMDTSKGGNKIQANYNVDLALDDNQVQGSGLVNGTPFVETARLNEGKLHWKSATGLAASGLVMEVGEDEQSITMKGTLGGVETDLTLSMFADEDGHLTGIKTTGALNGEPYSVKSTVDVEGLLAGRPMHHGHMHTEGLVNGEPIVKTYLVDAHRRSTGMEFKARVETAEGDDQTGGVVVNVIDRD